MKKLYLLSDVLVAQAFCFVGGNCPVHTEDLSKQSELGKEILEIVRNY